jgi:hypothetical protein
MTTTRDYSFDAERDPGESRAIALGSAVAEVACRRGHNGEPQGDGVINAPTAGRNLR